MSCENTRLKKQNTLAKMLKRTVLRLRGDDLGCFVKVRAAIAVEGPVRLSGLNDRSRDITNQNHKMTPNRGLCSHFVLIVERLWKCRKLILDSTI